MNAHDFTFNGIDGRPLPLKGFKGKVLLVVGAVVAKVLAAASAHGQ